MMSVTIDKGISHEYSVSTMFQGQGYITRRGIPLNYGNGLEATDVDVLGIAFTQPFKGYRVICDCKNKKAAKPYERIFWSKGLGEFVNASEIYISLPRASWDIIKFASKGGVRVLTNEILESYTKPNSNYGLADQVYYGEFISQIPQILKQDRKALDSWTISRSLWLEEDPYVGLNLALEWLSIAAKQYKFNLSHSVELSNYWSFLICDLTVNVATQLLWICSDTLGFPEKAREEHITTKLTYGNLEPNYVKSLIQNFGELANEMVKSAIPKQYLPPGGVVDFGEISAPQYTNNFIGLVDRAYNNPEWYINMPQFLDVLLFEKGLKGKPIFDGSEQASASDSTITGKLKSARNIMAFVREHCDVDWSQIWANRKQEQGINQEHDVQAKTIATKSVSQAQTTNRTVEKEEVEQVAFKIEETGEVKEASFDSDTHQTTEVKQSEIPSEVIPKPDASTTTKIKDESKQENNIKSNDSTDGVVKQKDKDNAVEEVKPKRSNNYPKKKNKGWNFGKKK